jgi:outer membrane receptor protein involved in Fe transport
MKHNLISLSPAAFEAEGARNRRAYRAAILAATLAWGTAAAAYGQSTNTAPPAAAAAGSAGSSTNVVKLPPTVVVGKLDVAREQISPQLGATVFDISKNQIQALPEGENASLNQVLLHAPGMVEDSEVNSGLHLRGEHGNIQYRINDVLLPEGISGFGQELSPRFVDTLHLITGSLPAQYGFRTAGVVDIHTKSGAFAPGGEVGTYGGKYETINPTAEYGGSQGNLNFYADASYDHNGIGIENPTSSWAPIHDITDQEKAFTYLSYVLDDTSRVSFMGSLSYSDFQIPNTPGLAAGTAPNGRQWVAGDFNSASLDENQNEQNYYGVLAYQKSVGDFNLQVAGFGRVSAVHFRPDIPGDLYFNGVASDVDRKLYSGGVQADASYALGEKHTLRGGVMVMEESLAAHSTTTVFPVDANGNPVGAAFPIDDNSGPHALFAGVYLQDEWKLLPKLTLNYGARFDLYYASFDKENQPSPRVNLIYQPTDTTTLHAGYARYFTPPPLEFVNSTSVQKFDNTSNASATDQNSPLKAERANYFDAGISQRVIRGLQVGVDGYYKTAQNQIDDGLFGQTLIQSAFNYRRGEIYGVEFTSSFTKGGFSTYANVAYSVARGQDWVSAQFLFDPADLAYVQNHWIYLDHDQRVTGSFGASYLWKHAGGSTRVYADALYGSGLRTDATAPDGTTIPNGGTVPSYFSVSLGVEEGFKICGKERLKVRFDAVNITDNIYELRDGAGVGVNAAAYGARLGFFAGASYVF